MSGKFSSSVNFREAVTFDCSVPSKLSFLGGDIYTLNLLDFFLSF